MILSLRLVALLAAAVCALLPLTARADVAADRRALLLDVGKVAAPGCLPGPLAVFGADAFVVMVGKEDGQPAPLFAAARYGKGCVLVAGHEGFFGSETLRLPGNARFLDNALSWLAHGLPVSRLRVGIIGQEEMVPKLRAEVASAMALAPEDLPERIDLLDILFLNQASLDSDTTGSLVGLVRRFVEGGGGLIVAGPGWGWRATNPGKDLAHDHSGNRLLLPMGIAFADGPLDPTGKEEFVADGGGADRCHSAAALRELARYEDVNAGGPTPMPLVEATQTLARTIAALPPDDRQFVPRVAALCARHGGSVIPTRAAPVTTTMPFARLKIVLDARAMSLLPYDQMRAHPAAASFPGSVPANAPRVSRPVTIDTGVPGWHSTGLYAAPGETVTLRWPDGMGIGSKRLVLRIGAHTDTLWHLPTWERFPEITRRVEIETKIVHLANPFGGPVYVEVPEDCSLGILQTTVSGVVEAPYFIKGKTSLAAWRKAIRSRPAPWAELEGTNVTLTLPSSVVRTLDDPQALMTYWDEVVDRCADLFAVPSERRKRERYCVDRQISAGYMHSGYPIMTGEDVAKTFTDLAVLRGPDGNKTWGFYHELGHNFQQADWTWDGCGEVTNNLFSLHGGEALNRAYTGGDYRHTHPAIRPEERATRLEKYRAAGADYEEWKRDPFLALTLYIQLRRAFGWEPFTRVFAEYQSLAPAERPADDQAKRDQWMVRFSRAVGKNLSPFFQAWGVPTSEAARKSVADLPPWLPEEMKPSVVR
jgi:hypothetical protein